MSTRPERSGGRTARGRGFGANGLPYPGSGHTLDRWRQLAELSFGNTVSGRLAEAHADADAILVGLGDREVARGEVWDVWAAEPPRPVLRRPARDGWLDPEWPETVVFRCDDLHPRPSRGTNW